MVDKGNIVRRKEKGGGDGGGDKGEKGEQEEEQGCDEGQGQAAVEWVDGQL